jgi:hypothetical protein
MRDIVALSDNQGDVLEFWRLQLHIGGRRGGAAIPFFASIPVPSAASIALIRHGERQASDCHWRGFISVDDVFILAPLCAFSGSGRRQTPISSGKTSSPQGPPSHGFPAARMRGHFIMGYTGIQREARDICGPR